MDLVIEVARQGNFAAVARSRGVDPSWVSRTIASIEDDLGFRLFQRTTRRLALTEAGDIFLRRIEAIVEEFEQARDEALAVSAGPTGILRMTTSVGFGQKVIVPLVPRFRSLYPKVDLDLILSDSNLNLVNDRIDLAIRLAANMSGDGIVSKLMDTTYHVCASPDYLSRHGQVQTPSELKERDCLLFRLPGFRSHWVFSSAASEEIEVPVHGGIVVSSALAQHALTVAGMGPALLADWLADDDIQRGRLVNLFPNHTVTATTVETAAWLLYPSKSFLPQKVRVMIDFLRSEMTGRRGNL
ncbi:LysR family transcriptional regulator [Labrys miyagiensis]|uniref:LysR family transcriptional regulator n=1 Tax=Labrys miyagiensis TaxID=346912 RepID=A0ABQ6CJ40_9HYPH|nr:LysR family transcriptional regulator [Labrys miyagiensis]GLS18246.1 LysR family transcriptional regulator [Labrys miyagiensis]